MDTSSLIAVTTLGCIVVLGVGALLAILLLSIRHQLQSQPSVIAQQSTELRALIDELATATANHVEITSIMQLSEQLERQPELLVGLNSYSRNNVSSTLMLRVTRLGKAIEKGHERLDDALEALLSHPNESLTSYYTGQVKKIEEILEDLRAKLLAADANVASYEQNRSPGNLE